MVVAAVGIGVLAALSWLVWAGLFHSRPAVVAQVSAYTVVSDTAVDVILTVDRRDPTQPVTCRVLAQAADFSPVGEQEVGVEGSTARVVEQKLTLVTLRRAVAVTAKNCTVG